jgi:predicted deacylase
MAAGKVFTLGQQDIVPGTRAGIDLPVSVLANHTPMTLPVYVINGRRAGPTLFVSAAIHGDEIIGVEIVRRLLQLPRLNRIRGRLIAVPIVNAYGFISHSRYLPDRRDLNRSFPGSATGSLAAQLAHIFMTEVVKKSDFGIDLHSAAVHRVNLPQIRVTAKPLNPRTLELAEIFGAPIVIRSPLRPGSLRAIAQGAGVDMLLFEAGEGLRFDEIAIRAGVAGILRVMKALGMVATSPAPARVRPLVSDSTFWLRAPEGGILRAFKAVGASVDKDEVIAVVSDPFGEKEFPVTSHEPGLVVGRANLPIVNMGDALFHIARTTRTAAAAEKSVGEVEAALQAEPMFDEDEIV